MRGPAWAFWPPSNPGRVLGTSCYDGGWEGSRPMGTLGVQEFIVIFILALVLFGPKKLPELGRTIGKAITEFRRASNDLKATFEREMQTLERESQSMNQVAQVTASDIFNRALNYEPDHETRSLPPAETAWNPLDPPKGDSASQESLDS